MDALAFRRLPALPACHMTHVALNDVFNMRLNGQMHLEVLLIIGPRV
jgi:hypothetical protein